MMGENSVGPNAAAALSPSSVLCLFPNADMFAGAMGGSQRQQRRAAAAEDEQPLQRPPEEVLRNLRPQGQLKSNRTRRNHVRANMYIRICEGITTTKWSSIYYVRTEGRMGVGEKQFAWI